MAKAASPPAGDGTLGRVGGSGVRRGGRREGAGDDAGAWEVAGRSESSEGAGETVGRDASDGEGATTGSGGEGMGGGAAWASAGKVLPVAAGAAVGVVVVEATMVVAGGAVTLREADVGAPAAGG